MFLFYFDREFVVLVVVAVVEKSSESGYIYCTVGIGIGTHDSSNCILYILISVGQFVDNWPTIMAAACMQRATAHRGTK